MPAQKVPLSIGVQQVAAPAISNTFRRPLVGQGTMNSDTLPQQVSISSGPTPLRRPIVKGESPKYWCYHHVLLLGEIKHNLSFPHVYGPAFDKVILITIKILKWKQTRGTWKSAGGTVHNSSWYVWSHLVTTTFTIGWSLFSPPCTKIHCRFPGTLHTCL